MNPKGLAAVPWAPYCIQCQEMADGHKADGEDSELFEESLVSAA